MDRDFAGRQSLFPEIQFALSESFAKGGDSETVDKPSRLQFYLITLKGIFDKKNVFSVHLTLHCL